MAKSTKSKTHAKSRTDIIPELAIRMAGTITSKCLGTLAAESYLAVAEAQAESGKIADALTTARQAMDCIAGDKSKVADEISMRNENHKKLCEFMARYGTAADLRAALDVHESTIENIKDAFVKTREYLRRAEIADHLGDKKRVDSLLQKTLDTVEHVSRTKYRTSLYGYVMQACNRLGRKKQASTLLQRTIGPDFRIKSMIPGFSRKQILAAIGKIAPSEDERYDYYKAAAVESATAGLLDDAEYFYEKVLQANLDTEADESTLSELGLLLQNTSSAGLTRLAAKAFEAAETHAKLTDSFLPLRLEFNYLVDSGDLKRAESTLSRLPKHYRTQAGARIQLAVRYFHRKNKKEAIRLLTEAEKAADRCDQDERLGFYQIIGLYWFLIGNSKNGKETFEKCRKRQLYSNPPMEMPETALFQVRAGDRDGALATLALAQELAKKAKPTPNREELEVQARICEALLCCGETERAKQIFDTSFALLAEKPQSDWPEDYRRQDFAKAMVCKLINTFPLEECLREIDITEGPKRQCMEFQAFL